MISKKNITRRTFIRHGACIPTPKASTRHTRNSFSSYKLSLCGLVVFIDMNTYTEVGMSFRTFLKENYAVALDSCYLFTKKC